MGTHTDCTLFRYSCRQFFGTQTDSTVSRYAHRLYPLLILVRTVFRYSEGYYLSRYLRGFYHFWVLTQVVPSFDTRQDSFSVLAQILPFPILARILPFFGTHTDCTLFRISSGQFLGTQTDSTFSQYSLGFYHFWVLTQNVPSSDTRLDTFSILARILPFLDTRPDSTIFGY